MGADSAIYNCLDLALASGLYELDEAERYGDFTWMTLLPGPVIALHAGPLYLFSRTKELLIDSEKQNERFKAAFQFLKDEL